MDFLIEILLLNITNANAAAVNYEEFELIRLLKYLEEYE